jgi:hypothetical protein
MQLRFFGVHLVATGLVVVAMLQLLFFRDHPVTQYRENVVSVSNAINHIRWFTDASAVT